MITTLGCFDTGGCTELFGFIQPSSGCLSVPIARQTGPDGWFIRVLRHPCLIVAASLPFHACFANFCKATWTITANSSGNCRPWTVTPLTIVRRPSPRRRSKRLSRRLDTQSKPRIPPKQRIRRMILVRKDATTTTQRIHSPRCRGYVRCRSLAIVILPIVLQGEVQCRGQHEAEVVYACRFDA